MRDRVVKQNLDVCCTHDLRKNKRTIVRDVSVLGKDRVRDYTDSRTCLDPCVIDVFLPTTCGDSSCVTNFLGRCFSPSRSTVMI